MRKLGEVLHLARNGYIVVKVTEEKLPPLGVRVYDEYRRELGLLLDVIGPVKQPLAIIKPQSRDIAGWVREGLEIYYIPPKPKKPRRRERSKLSGRSGRGRGRSRGRK